MEHKLNHVTFKDATNGPAFVHIAYHIYVPIIIVQPTRCTFCIQFIMN
jgi:hypothetical protein